MGLKGKILKFMSDISKDEYCYKLHTQAKSTSACGLPKGVFFIFSIASPGHEPMAFYVYYDFVCNFLIPNQFSDVVRCG